MTRLRPMKSCDRLIKDLEILNLMNAKAKKIKWELNKNDIPFQCWKDAVTKYWEVDPIGPSCGGEPARGLYNLVIDEMRHSTEQYDMYWNWIVKQYKAV